MGKNQSKLSPEQLVDLQKNTYFDKKELRQWHKKFLDYCPSGQVDLAGFKTIVRSFVPIGEPMEFAEALFRVVDEDKNGMVDYKEFICALSTVFRARPEEKLRFAFTLYDVDGDGFISYKDMLFITTAMYRLTGSISPITQTENTPEVRAWNAFEAMDKNKDGRLDFQEFVEGGNNDPLIVQALLTYEGYV